MQIENKIKILEVADRLGWAISRLSRPLSERYENIDIVYKNISAHRFLASGYDKKENGKPYIQEQAEKYDIVHFHHPQSCWKDARGLSSKVRKIATKHTEREIKDIDWNVFDDIICPTKFVLAQMMSKNVKANLHYIPYGVDLNVYRLNTINSNSEYIGYVGRVVKWKRLNVLLKEVKKANLKLLGCGYIEDGATFGKQDRLSCKWHNFFPERQMFDFYSQMSLFVCISEPNIETGTLPILEAMSCGIPVISTKIGWAKDNCTNGKDIWFVEEKDIQEGRLNLAIKYVYENKELRATMRENALQLIKNFSIEKYCDNLMNIYKK